MFNVLTMSAKKNISFDSIKKSMETVVEAFTDDSDTELTLILKEKIGNVSISIIDDTGAVVYMNRICTPGEIIISLDAFSVGSYTILISCENKILSGYFNIE